LQLSRYHHRWFGSTLNLLPTPPAAVLPKLPKSVSPQASVSSGYGRRRKAGQAGPCTCTMVASAHAAGSSSSQATQIRLCARLVGNNSPFGRRGGLRPEKIGRSPQAAQIRLRARLIDSSSPFGRRGGSGRRRLVEGGVRSASRRTRADMKQTEAN
jgi:hypothetical protein